MEFRRVNIICKTHLEYCFIFIREKDTNLIIIVKIYKKWTIAIDNININIWRKMIVFTKGNVEFCNAVHRNFFVLSLYKHQSSLEI